MIKPKYSYKRADLDYTGVIKLVSENKEAEREINLNVFGLVTIKENGNYTKITFDELELISKYIDILQKENTDLLELATYVLTD